MDLEAPPDDGWALPLPPSPGGAESERLGASLEEVISHAGGSQLASKIRKLRVVPVVMRLPPPVPPPPHPPPC